MDITEADTENDGRICKYAVQSPGFADVALNLIGDLAAVRFPRQAIYCVGLGKLMMRASPLQRSCCLHFFLTGSSSLSKEVTPMVSRGVKSLMTQRSASLIQFHKN